MEDIDAVHWKCIEEAVRTSWWKGNAYHMYLGIRHVYKLNPNITGMGQDHAQFVYGIQITSNDHQHKYQGQNSSWT